MTSFSKTDSLILLFNTGSWPCHCPRQKMLLAICFQTSTRLSTPEQFFLSPGVDSLAFWYSPPGNPILWSPHQILDLHCPVLIQILSDYLEVSESSPVTHSLLPSWGHALLPSGCLGARAPVCGHNHHTLFLRLPHMTSVNSCIRSRCDGFLGRTRLFSLEHVGAFLEFSSLFTLPSPCTTRTCASGSYTDQTSADLSVRTSQ